MKLEAVLGQDDFLRLFKLALEFPWLCNREEALLELWASTREDENQKRLIEYLIHQFLYVDSDMSVNFCKEIVNQITLEWKLDPRHTLVSAICDDSKPDGSQLMVQKMKNQFPFWWLEYNFVNSLLKAVHQLHSNDNFVICDDFIGTGHTLSCKIKYVKNFLEKEHIENVKIYIVSFAAMEFSRDAISEWGYPIFACRWLPKGISETLTGERQSIAIYLMEKMENLLNPCIGRMHLPHFGYGRSESLYNYEDDNIPNNVFPVFWWRKYKDGSFRRPMFRRI